MKIFITIFALISLLLVMAVIPVLNVSAVDKVIPLYNNVDKERAICVHTGRCEIEQPAPVLTPAPELQYQPPTNDSLK